MQYNPQMQYMPPQPSAQYMPPQPQPSGQYMPPQPSDEYMPPQPPGTMPPVAEEGFLEKLWDHTPFGWAYNSFFGSSSTPPVPGPGQPPAINTGGRRRVLKSKTHARVRQSWKNVMMDLRNGKRVLSTTILEAAQGQNPEKLLEYALSVEVGPSKLKRLRTLFKTAYSNKAAMKLM